MSGKYNKDYDPISESKKIFYPLSNNLLPFFHELNFKPNDVYNTIFIIYINWFIFLFKR